MAGVIAEIENRSKVWKTEVPPVVPGVPGSWTTAPEYPLISVPHDTVAVRCCPKSYLGYR